MIDKENSFINVFNRISICYDKASNLQTFGGHKLWKRDLVDEVYERGCREVLDVCCGAGDLILQIAQLPAVRRAAGIDFSENMLNIATGRAAFAESPDGCFVRPEFILHDAEDLPFDDNSFDCVVISFGLSSALSPPDIAREIFRVLKPGGLFLCLESFRPIKIIQKLLFAFRNKLVAPLFMWSMRSDYGFIVAALKSFYSLDELTILLKQVGFSNILFKTYRIGQSALISADKAATA